ncbi:hypothetical protein Z043_109384 [Scleropages formosus]|uniref:Uncharacterized protein n=1 Tax=Scleropages formosus TaxID=113540 RepID=A0A0P7UC73_SCLFO|nr:hypothetical protein Z043_109384 [Scleropages formosus]
MPSLGWNSTEAFNRVISSVELHCVVWNVEPNSAVPKLRLHTWAPPVVRYTHVHLYCCPLTAPCDLCCSAVDVKTDDRAEMSVAAKMSLFKELEKHASPEISSFLRPRSGAGVQDRRARRTADQRALTQPVTGEEMVVAASQPRSTTAGESVDLVLVGAKPEEEDESSKLTLGEKLALFTKLAQPDGKAGVPHEAADKRRQKGARYRTQPITLDEVDLVRK